MAKVLIVDDDETLRDAYTLVVGDHHQVKAAADGESGLKLAKEFEPDVIILDMIMPYMNGLTFVQHYQPSKHPDTKIIILSNSNAETDAKQALALGASKYVLKSHYTPTQVLELIDQALGV